MNTAGIVGLTVVGLVGGILVLGSTEVTPTPRMEARRVIELCWSDYERKSLDPATKRFIAATCEKLENDFLTRFGHRP